MRSKRSVDFAKSTVAGSMSMVWCARLPIRRGAVIRDAMRPVLAAVAKSSSGAAVKRERSRPHSGDHHPALSDPRSATAVTRINNNLDSIIYVDTKKFPELWDKYVLMTV